jgi:uncharacterized protein DUF3300
MFNGMLHLSSSRVARALLLAVLVFALLGAAPTTPHRRGDPSSSQDELDGLLAPIGLYPDGLLSQVLMASTYPLEVVEADRFVQRNPGLHGEALDEALAKKNWDPSVQSLAAYPKVLAMMSEMLEWTERLGDAFLEDQGRVMDTVQSLRRRAEASGNLKSSAEQTVVRDKETIVIEPAQKEVVYVVEYDPAVVYGSWWYAAAYDYYNRYYGHYAYIVSVSYTSYRISSNHWGWARANWHDRNLSIDGRENRFWSSAGRSQAATGAWQHDTTHRRGVEYPSSAMRDRLGAGNAGAGHPGDNGRGRAPSALGSGEPTNIAGKGSPNGPFQLPGGSRSAPLESPDPARGPFADRAMPNFPSMPAGGLPSFGGGGPPMGGPPMGGPPPAPPGPH